MLDSYFSNDKPQKILIVTAERIGDALFCTPAIRLLKQSKPETQFDILALSKVAGSIFTYNPAVSRIWITNNKLLIKRIAGQYPVIINLFYEMKKYLDKLPHDPLSIGKPNLEKHRAQQAIEFANFLLTSSTQVTETLHYDIYPQPEHTANIRRILSHNGLHFEGDILIGLQLGCHRVARRSWKFWNKDRHRHQKVWPLENYIELAHALNNHNKKIKLILTGSDDEKFLGKMFIKECPFVTDLIGKTNLFEVAALMDHLSLYITHDTGTMHIACARNTPLVALFGPTPINFTGPYPKNTMFSVITKNSMLDIQVNEVFKMILAKLPLSSEIRFPGNCEVVA